eukprot:NODE_2876_length_1098_cov_169.163966_g2638_i0.p1 GENE.NODE_2876_length_1098_cov_169.163966_g2638_i0~~NODE_2876_length_1098_cov_169.163966_g2638_i0.p1  ORF type:complete len:298 (-),score=61.07 NODE_2876_length_1098_cov_169.163966_g2638_i0:205-1044(-)
MPVIFKDLYKPVKDLLTKNYNGDKNKLELKSKDAVTFNPVFTRDAAGAITAAVSLEGEYDPCQWAHLKLKYEVDTKGKLSTRLTVERLLVGLKVEGSADLALGDGAKKDVYEGKVEFKKKSVNFVGSVTHKKESLLGDASLVLAYQILTLGAAATFAGGKLASQSAGLVWDASKSTSVAALLTNWDKLAVGVVTKQGQNTLGGEYSSSVSKPQTGVISVGLERGLGAGSVGKVKLLSTGLLGASIAQKVSSEWKVTSSVEIDTAKGWSSVFGSTLTYES